MAIASKYVVTKHFKGMPKRSDFELQEYELSPLGEDEILVKAEWISVDPYIRAYNIQSAIPYDQFGFQVGIVEDSTDPDYPIGTRVVSHKGWCDYSIVNTKSNNPFDSVYQMPDLGGLSPSIALGAVGMTGATAYLAFLDICDPKEGDTVVITAAAGAVGSIVGQIAKLKGCKVIGFAGCDNKVQWLEEIGFDKVFNYKTADIVGALKAAAPDGIDCYFDNVGGELSSAILYQMKNRGRVAVCGSISSYNEDPLTLPKVTIVQPAIVLKQVKVEGFMIWEHSHRWAEAFGELLKWIHDGDLVVKEQVTEGFDNIYDAFVGMLAGKNVGKAVVRIS